jgi:hypothetical protein
MTVAGQGMRQAARLHDGEADAIGEGPVLVGALAKQLDAFLELK